MRDQPCQRGNQPCRCDASLSNLSFAFLFARCAYTNTHAMTLFSTECGLTQCRGVNVACAPLYFKANKSIPPFHLWLNRQGQGSISSHGTRRDIEGKDATPELLLYQWRYQVLISWVIDSLSPSANQRPSPDAGVQCNILPAAAISTIQEIAREGLPQQHRQNCSGSGLHETRPLITLTSHQHSEKPITGPNLWWQLTNENGNFHVIMTIFKNEIMVKCWARIMKKSFINTFLSYANYGIAKFIHSFTPLIN